MDKQNKGPSSTVFLVEDPARWACRYSERPSIATPLFIQYRVGGQARLLDISGGVDPDWTALEQLGIEEDFGLPIDDALWHQVQTLLNKGDNTGAFDHLVHTMGMRSEEWSNFADTVSKGRYFASAWFERDRQNLVLTDTLSGKDVVELWDEEVSHEIESGNITPPRFPRPSDEDWLAPLLSFAREMGLVRSPNEVWSRHELTQQSNQASRPREQAA